MENIREKVEDYDPAPITRQRKNAVLLPLVYSGNELSILYEVRSGLVSQPGETSFPGGGVEEGETFREAALRETEEEIGIKGDEVEILGEIDYIVTESSVIRCFVGYLSDLKESDLRINEEVARVFTISIRWLKENPPKFYKLNMKPAVDNDFPFEKIENGQDYKFNSSRRSIPFYSYEKEVLWGMTANLTNRFIEIIS